MTDDLLYVETAMNATRVLHLSVEYMRRLWRPSLLSLTEATISETRSKAVDSLLDQIAGEMTGKVVDRPRRARMYDEEMPWIVLGQEEVSHCVTTRQMWRRSRMATLCLDLREVLMNAIE